MLGYGLNGNLTFTAEQHAIDQDRVSLQRQHTRRDSKLTDLPGAQIDSTM